MVPEEVDGHLSIPDRTVHCVHRDRHNTITKIESVLRKLEQALLRALMGKSIEPMTQQQDRKVLCLERQLTVNRAAQPIPHPFHGHCCHFLPEVLQDPQVGIGRP